MRAIIAGGKNKMGVKKVSWKGRQTPLVQGMMMRREENPEVKIIGHIKTLKNRLKDLQVKNIDWEDIFENKKENQFEIGKEAKIRLEIREIKKEEDGQASSLAPTAPDRLDLYC